MSLSNGDRLGPYEILGTVGAGGMGEVYRARDPRLDRLVAVKVLPHDRTADADARARFDREARAIAAVSHPNICVIYDVGHEGAVDYIVMELLEGETLQAAIRRGPLPIALAVDYGIALSDALDTAHARGLIHRDLKPANVFVTARGVPKILDFGLAKLTVASDDTTRGGGEALTRFGETYGTLAYMSPEQLRGETLDRTTDIFSIGLVLYEMATGKRAFDGPTGVVVASMILKDPVPDPRTIRADLPDRFVEILDKCLEKDRRLRMPSAEALRVDLMRFKQALASTTVAGTIVRPPAHVPAPIEPPTPARKRPPVLAVAALAAIVLSAAVTAYMLWRGRQEPEAVTPPVRSQDRIAAGPASPQPAPPASASSEARPPAAMMPAAEPPRPTAAAAPTDVPAPARLSATPPPPSRPTTFAIDITPLTPPVRTSLPAISPDGRSVVFRRIDRAGASLWRTDIGSGKETPILEPTAARRIMGFVVAPDGMSVDVLGRTVETASAQGPPELLRLPYAGGTPVRIVNALWSPAEWSPDRAHLAFVGLEPGATNVIVSDADGTHPRVVARRNQPSLYVTLNTGLVLSRPSWSPDGKRIAVVGRTDNWHIAVIDVASGAEDVMPSPDAASIETTAWIDDTHLVVARATLGTANQQLWLLDVKSKAYTPVTHDTYAYGALTIANDRRVAAAARQATRAGLWLGGRAGEGLHQVLSDEDTAALSVSVSNAGRIVYSIGAGIWVLDPGAAAPRLVVKSGLGPVLAPDGETIVYSDVLHQQLLRTDVMGAKSSVIVDGSARDPAVSPDGRTVFFSSFRRSQWTIWTVPIDGGPPREVFSDDVGLAPQVSPDGRRLMYASTGAGVRVCILPACSNRQTWAASTKWTPDGRLAFADQSTISVRPLGPAPPQPIVTFSDRVVVSFAWSPDGTKLVATRAAVSAEVVLLKIRLSK